MGFGCGLNILLDDRDLAILFMKRNRPPQMADRFTHVRRCFVISNFLNGEYISPYKKAVMLQKYSQSLVKACYCAASIFSADLNILLTVLRKVIYIFLVFFYIKYDVLFSSISESELENLLKHKNGYIFRRITDCII